MNQRENKFLEHPTTKLVGIILLTLLLIMVSLILFEDVGLNNALLIYNIFGTLALISFLYSFYATSRKLYNDLSLGVSRKEFYINYLKNIGLVLLISIFLVIYYILVYKIIIGVNVPIFESFDLGKLIYLPIMFLAVTFLGFTLGIVKLKKRFFYTLVGIITILVVLSLIYLTIKYLLSIFLSVIIIALGVYNYILVKNIDV